MRYALLAAVLVALLSGCVSPPGAGGDEEDQGHGTDPRRTFTRWPPTTPVPGVFHVLVVDVRLVGEHEDARHANVGPHCGSVDLYEDHVAVEKTVYDAMNGSKVLVVVNGSVEGNWSTFGSEPYGLPVPANLTVSVDSERILVARLTWNETTSRVLVDGEEVALPYDWTIDAPDDSWRIHASLEVRTTNIEVWERVGLCH